MHRVGKLLWIILILWFVFFIICDEKWYKIEWNQDHLVLVEMGERAKSATESRIDNIVNLQPIAVYKDSDLIRIYPGFKDSNILRNSDWMDPEYLAKVEEEKRLEEERKRLEEERKKIEEEREKQAYMRDVMLNDENSISKVFQWLKENQSVWNTDTWDVGKNEVEEPILYYPVEKITHDKIVLNLSKSVEVPKVTIEKKIFRWIVLNLSKWTEIPRVKVERYSLRGNLALNLYGGKPRILYRNSDMIEIYSWFESPRNMYSSSGVDENFLVKQKNAVIISLNDRDAISSVWKNDGENTGDVQDEYDRGSSGEHNWNLGDQSITSALQDSVENVYVEKDDMEDANVESWNYVWEYLNSWENVRFTGDKDEAGWNGQDVGFFSTGNWNFLDERTIATNKTRLMNISKWVLPEPTLVKVSKYNTNRHTLNMKKWIMKEYDFVVENTEDSSQNGISDEILESLLGNEEINIDTLESENDEFLQQVFEKTRDTYIMNLIVENYLNEYQFVKAKKFIENLPELYYKDLKPSLNLRVAFNSFALTSKTTNETLTSLIQSYKSKNQISDEDWNWYLWILALIQRDYDKFFTIAGSLTSDSRKAFAAKILWYKDQISKQMWMPEYYFDTLVALELFNQWLFQPAKVLALYSLQKNPDYILPHQILAYANFLTNSWDTSVEYLKKLADLDQNNAEKYRFLMGVAYYWAEKYEQSVTMLSTIQSDNLRLDAQRYLINDYLQLDQKNKLIASRNKLLWYENLVASDFYTYFYEVFYHPYSEGGQYQLYAFDTELANKMLRVCSMKLSDDERAVCTYGSIGRNIALWKFDWLEQYLLDLTSQYPQWYLYQALWEYYIQQWDSEKAKVYLLKAVSLINSKNKSEISQVKKLLETIM